jgi:hypothetical protein
MPRGPKHRGKPSTHKRAVAVEAVPSRREPMALVGVDPMRQHPAWRVSLLEMASPFGWSDVSPEKLREVRDKLRDFESMTWHEILVAAKHRNHAVAIDKLCKQARDRLEELGQADIEDLISLRLSGPERVWGILNGHVLKILWWDPEHAVCPSLKKHT